MANSYMCATLRRRIEANDRAHAMILLQCSRCHDKYCPGPVTLKKEMTDFDA